MTPRARAGSLALAGVLAFAGTNGGCRRADPDGVERAEFGVLYGGDIQDREVIPLELDREKQELGLRVTFAAPLARATPLRWEIAKPTASHGADGGLLYATELGEMQAAAGERRADGRFAFRAGDLPGVWHVRVFVGARTVLDRHVRVVSAKP